MPNVNHYEDIIDLSHHVSDTRPNMTRINRAAQFAPFAALTGYGDVIAEAARLTEEKLELTGEEQLMIGEKLNLLKTLLPQRPTVTIIYFRPDKKKAGGEYIERTGVVKRIRESERELTLEDGTIIRFEDILEIDGQIFLEFPQ